ncbi:MAG: hypothetical protein P4L53_03905 [Candidatus Obscuribacterales bacterium]|nr:hypothetical protein [Candidatus Obscuribacterales bacterium]
MSQVFESSAEGREKPKDAPTASAEAVTRAFQQEVHPGARYERPSFQEHVITEVAKEDLVRSLSVGDFNNARAVLEKAGACRWVEMLYDPIHADLPDLQTYDPQSGTSRKFTFNSINPWHYDALSGKVDFGELRMQEITGTTGFVRDLLLNAGLVKDDYKEIPRLFIKTEPCEK